MHPISPGDVARGRDHAARTATHDQGGLSARTGRPFLDRGIEGVAIDVGDRQFRDFRMTQSTRGRAAGLAAAGGTGLRGAIAAKPGIMACRVPNRGQPAPPRAIRIVCGSWPDSAAKASMAGSLLAR